MTTHKRKHRRERGPEAVFDRDRSKEGIRGSRLIDFELGRQPSLQRSVSLLGRPGNDLLSRVLRRSTIGAGAFHGRVRDGIGCSHSAIATRSAEK